MYSHILVDSSDERINASESGQLLWFGDCAPNLDRDWPMLFEQVARRLINVEELKHTLETEEEPYEAACQGRFSSPEFYGPQVAAFARDPRSHRQEGLRLGSLDASRNICGGFHGGAEYRQAE